jgi:hypothetical protein
MSKKNRSDFAPPDQLRSALKIRLMPIGKSFFLLVMQVKSAAIGRQAQHALKLIVPKRLSYAAAAIGTLPHEAFLQIRLP